MKRFVIACCCAFLMAGIFVYATFYQGFYLDLGTKDEPSVWVKQEGKTILVDRGDGYTPFEIRGVDIGTSIPGHFATDYAIDKETYLRWFKQIQDMGANTLRVYILQNTAFYEALYEFNTDNPHPLYLIQGVWIDDYTQNSHRDAFDSEYLNQFKEDIRCAIDVVHGNRAVELGTVAGTGTYIYDVSDWVLGYLLGADWDSATVAFTDMQASESSYQGTYMKTAENASPFETMLAQAGDEAFRYETQRYSEQRLVAFSNRMETDPFSYSRDIEELFGNYESIDVEHLVCTDQVKSGTFASYHLYEGDDAFLRLIPEYQSQRDPQGEINTYYTYLRLLNEHHSVPVVIAEYGASTARGIAQTNSQITQDEADHALNEDDQASILAHSYRSIMQAGCAGSIVSCWQDEWFKRTWNTMANVDLLKSPYWSDYQTNEQSFGLLTFDPGAERSVSYVDGDDEEWTEQEVVSNRDGESISVKYDEEFIYFMVKGADISASKPLYIPIDTTFNTGSYKCDSPALSFDKAVDFVVVLDGENSSKILVQNRYDASRAVWLRYTTGEDPFVDPPAKDSSTFSVVTSVLRTDGSGAIETLQPLVDPSSLQQNSFRFKVNNTGELTCGDANPHHESYNSLADFCYGEGFVEVRIPWELLNFSNPSEMQIHDDYYEHWGIENLSIDSISLGVGDGSKTIALDKVDLKGWGESVTYHERLKNSYYAMKQLWADDIDPTSVLNQFKRQR